MATGRGASLSATKQINCRNCGAPHDWTRCEYCGTFYSNPVITPETIQVNKTGINVPVKFSEMVRADHALNDAIKASAYKNLYGKTLIQQLKS